MELRDDARAGQQDSTLPPSLPLPVLYQPSLPPKGGWLPLAALHGAIDPGPGVTDLPGASEAYLKVGLTRVLLEAKGPVGGPQSPHSRPF